MREILKNIITFISEPVNCLILIVIFMIFTKYIFNFEYFNCGEIIKDYSKCFRSKKRKADKESYNIGAIVIAFVFPLILAYISIDEKLLCSEIVDNITVVISILTAMFFTLLALVIDIKARYEDKMEKENANASDICKIRSLINSIYYAIMFEILISICTLIMCFVSLLTDTHSYISSFITYYFTFILIINLFMLLKRIYKIIKKEMN